MNVRRRYEILLPLQFNDGGAVPKALLWQTVEELKSRFGIFSWDSQTVRGEQEGTVYRDSNTRLVLDVEDSPENHAFFTAFKAVLKTRFKQTDIWITSHPVDVI